MSARTTENKRDLKKDLEICRVIPSNEGELDQCEKNVIMKKIVRERAWDHAIERALIAEQMLELVFEKLASVGYCPLNLDIKDNQKCIAVNGECNKEEGECLKNYFEEKTLKKLTSILNK